MDLATTIYAILCIFGAAVVRGFSGFGFSLIAITALSLALSPVTFIASVYMMEIAASLHLLPGVWKDVRWRTVGLLLAGVALGTPIGLYALSSVPEPPMKVVLGLVVLVATVALAAGFGLKRDPSAAATLTTGAATGLLNGAFGIAGPPLILFFFSTPMGMAAGRASVIALFLGTDIYALGLQAADRLLTLEHVWRALLFLPALFAGVALGARGFKRVNPETFRMAVLVLLGLMAIATGVQGALALLPG